MSFYFCIFFNFTCCTSICFISTKYCNIFLTCKILFLFLHFIKSKVTNMYNSSNEYELFFSLSNVLIHQWTPYRCDFHFLNDLNISIIMETLRVGKFDFWRWIFHPQKKQWIMLSLKYIPSLKRNIFKLSSCWNTS